MRVQGINWLVQVMLVILGIAILCTLYPPLLNELKSLVYVFKPLFDELTKIHP